ncbi:MAG: hypothetical protein U0587_12765 [Candidatus Binatia bacterium]
METSRRGILAIAVGVVILWSVGSVVAGDTDRGTKQGGVVQLTLAVEGMH